MAERERSRLTQLDGGYMFYGSGPCPPSLTAVHDPLFLLCYRGYHPELSSAIGHLWAAGAYYSYPERVGGRDVDVVRGLSRLPCSELVCYGYSDG